MQRSSVKNLVNLGRCVYLCGSPSRYRDFSTPQKVLLSIHLVFHDPSFHSLPSSNCNVKPQTLIPSILQVLKFIVRGSWLLMLKVALRTFTLSTQTLVAVPFVMAASCSDIWTEGSLFILSLLSASLGLFPMFRD